MAPRVASQHHRARNGLTTLPQPYSLAHATSPKAAELATGPPERLRRPSLGAPSGWQSGPSQHFEPTGPPPEEGQVGHRYVSAGRGGELPNPYDCAGAGGTRRLDADRRVLQHHGLGSWHPEALSRQQVTLRVRLAPAHVLSAYKHGGEGQPGGTQAGHRQLPPARGHYRPLVGREGLDELSGARYRAYVPGVLHLVAVDPVQLLSSALLGHQHGDRVHRAPTLHQALYHRRVQAELSRPAPPRRSDAGS